jgi:outer membrane protein assembly factor BamB
MKRLYLLFILLFASYILSAQHIVEWRYDRTGIYSKETGLLKSWPAEGPEMLWYFEGLGNGHTSVAIADDKLFVTGEHDNRGFLYVFDLNGKLLHKIEYGSEFTNTYPGTRSTVVPNDGRLYITSGTMDLLCYDMQTMNLLWKKNYTEDFGVENLRHGWVGPALIVGEKLIITPGGPEHNVVALNKVTGEMIWISAGQDSSFGAYSTPIFVGDQQIPQIVAMMSDHVIGVNIANGELLWSHPYAGRWREHPNTPIYHDNMIFTMTSRSAGAMMLRLIDGGRNVERVWVMPEMTCRSGHAMKFGNYVYGSGDRVNRWHVVNWNTGEVAYTDSTLASGNIILADDMFYIYTERGEMVLAKPSPGRFDIVSRFPITKGTDQHWAHPVIYKGVMYIRHGDALMAYKIK